MNIKELLKKLNIGEDELEDLPEHEMSPKEDMFPNLLESRDEKIDRMVKFNKDKSDFNDKRAGKAKQDLNDLSKENKARKNAIDGLKSGTSIEIKEIKILPKKKKKDEDDDLADVPTMVTGSY
jgi:hypothetical protein